MIRVQIRAMTMFTCSEPRVIEPASLYFCCEYNAPTSGVTPLARPIIITFGTRNRLLTNAAAASALTL